MTFWRGLNLKLSNDFRLKHVDRTDERSYEDLRRRNSKNCASILRYFHRIVNFSFPFFFFNFITLLRENDKRRIIYRQRSLWISTIMFQISLLQHPKYTRKEKKRKKKETFQLIQFNIYRQRISYIYPVSSRAVRRADALKDITVLDHVIRAVIVR